MQVTIHASAQEEPFIVKALRFEVPSQGKWCVSLDIRQPSERSNDGLRFILRDAAQFRDLIMQLVTECEKVQAEEREEFDRALRAKIHAVMDARAALKARATTKVPYESPFSETDEQGTNGYESGTPTEHASQEAFADRCASFNCSSTGTEEFEGKLWCAPCRNFYAAAKAEAR